MSATTRLKTLLGAFKERLHCVKYQLSKGNRELDGHEAISSRKHLHKVFTTPVATFSQRSPDILSAITLSKQEIKKLCYTITCIWGMHCARNYTQGSRESITSQATLYIR